MRIWDDDLVLYNESEKHQRVVVVRFLEVDKQRDQKMKANKNKVVAI